MQRHKLSVRVGLMKIGRFSAIFNLGANRVHLSGT